MWRLKEEGNRQRRQLKNMGGLQMNSLVMEAEHKVVEARPEWVFPGMNRYEHVSNGAQALLQGYLGDYE